MSDALKLGFGPFAAPAKGCSRRVLRRWPQIRSGHPKALGRPPAWSARAAKAERFTGKSGSALELVVPEGLKVARLVVIGAGKAGDLKPKDFAQARRARHGQAAGRGAARRPCSPNCRAAP